MNILLRKVLIAYPGSVFNNSVKDILVSGGVIKSIDDAVDAQDADVIDIPGLVVSPGWVDIFSHFADPGLEYRETLETGAAAAAAGGFTTVFAIPNTAPAIQSKTQAEYVVQKSKSLPVNIYPLGAVTKNLEGKELAEMYDMHASGAVAFSDGTQPVQSAGLLLKALQYVKAFDGVVVQVPMDKSIGQYGLINEGVVSTRLGLPGIPAMAEELIVARDIKLARYAESKIHFTGVSTAKSMEYIKRAKDAGLQVTCSVTPYHLYFCDEDMVSYDTNLKVTPPLRSKADREALKDAVLNGWVDCVASHHIPHNWDSKVCEFEYAKHGMIGLQTAYAVLQTAIPQLNAAQVVNLLCTNASKIFNLPTPGFAEGEAAALTLFNPAGQTRLTKENNKSKSANSPFFDQTLTGEVVGIINRNGLYRN
ncbi:dihydroorotase [Foetidibacter luteolus]|uniref:dihydroorotase n=1 Tax=Foetidibacter luteolus TaxID=2608880 RepID=UPI00129A9B26|nr:dihydroorotase [Foetidibacter luteolus]